MCSNCFKMNRRDFVALASLGLAAPNLLASSSSYIGGKLEWDPDLPMVQTGKELIVQPLLRHQIESRRNQTSWRNWGDVHTEQAALEEAARINKELQALKQKADFPLKILPVERATTDEQAVSISQKEGYDLMLLYAAGSNYEKGLDPCIALGRFNLIFLRHQSGPLYDFYENAHNRFLRVGGKDFEYDQLRYYGGMGPDDIIVDDYDEILWRVRSFYAVQNLLGRKIVALGGASGKGCPRAPEVAQDKFKMDIVEISYDDLKKRISSAKSDGTLKHDVEKLTERYLKIEGTNLNTKVEFISNAFLLYHIFKGYMRENNVTAFTIRQCMRVIIPISETTACLPLSLLNDEGYLAFCESDFTAIPAGILLHHVSGKPVFLNNPTFPHKGIVTCAHCTCPRRMDGKNYNAVEITTHYESDYGAAPKVTIPPGQKVTIINPDASQKRWLGFVGEIEENPYLPICRSQQEVKILGDWKRLIKEIRGSHWLMAYDNCVRDMDYATKKAGLDFLNLSEA